MLRQLPAQIRHKLDKGTDTVADGQTETRRRADADRHTDTFSDIDTDRHTHEHTHAHAYVFRCRAFTNVSTLARRVCTRAHAYT